MMREARSLQRVVEMLERDLESDSPGTFLFNGKFVAGPILLAQATELALKAWQCRKRNGSYDRSHDLLDLFDGLDEDTKARLEAALPDVHLVAKLAPGRATMREIRYFHRKMFERWRYRHEMV